MDIDNLQLQITKLAADVERLKATRCGESRQYTKEIAAHEERLRHCELLKAPDEVRNAALLAMGDFEIRRFFATIGSDGVRVVREAPDEETCNRWTGYLRTYPLMELARLDRVAVPQFVKLRGKNPGYNWSTNKVYASASMVRELERANLGHHLSEFEINRARLSCWGFEYFTQIGGSEYIVTQEQLDVMRRAVPHFAYELDTGSLVAEPLSDEECRTQLLQRWRNWQLLDLPNKPWPKMFTLDSGPGLDQGRVA